MGFTRVTHVVRDCFVSTKSQTQFNAREKLHNVEAKLREPRQLLHIVSRVKTQTKRIASLFRSVLFAYAQPVGVYDDKACVILQA